MKTAAPEKKSAKTLKGQLFGAISMMLVAAIALGTSTYAWFVNNSTVEVQNMNLTVSASTSMTVAVGKVASLTAPTDATSWTGYKTVITNGDIDGTGTGADKADWTNMFVYPMDPASTTDALLAGTPANLKFFRSDGVVAADAKLATFNDLKVGRGVDATAANNYPFVGEGYVKRIPLRFLSSTDLDVYFGKDEATNVSEFVSAITAGVADVAQAEAIQKALRVAIVARADAADTPSILSCKVIQFDDGTAHIAGATDNTAYGTANITGLTHDETAGAYIGISTTSGTTGGTVTAAGALTAELPCAVGANYLATVTGTTVTAPTTPETLFTLQAGVARDVDVFIWLEGTDTDAVSTLSSYKFNLALPFAAVSPTT